MLAPLSIELGMMYGGEPTVPQALTKLRESGAQRILVVPLFPQYCGATTGAVYDQVSDELRFVQLTPPGSACSISLTSGAHQMAPGSLEGLQLVVSDVDVAQ